MLAQINFAEVPPLEGFPHKGILQFYIAGGEDDLYGASFSPDMDESWKVVYFPQPELNLENIITNYEFLPKPERFPLDGCCSLQFTKKYAPISFSDDRFKIILGEDLYYLIDDEEKIYDEYMDISLAYSHKMGGYPDFIEYDVRIVDDPEYEQDPDILLLQIGDDLNNEVATIMWADGGIGYFFIYESDLKKLNFSNVYYTWQR